MSNASSTSPVLAGTGSPTAFEIGLAVINLIGIAITLVTAIFSYLGRRNAVQAKKQIVQVSDRVGRVHNLVLTMVSAVGFSITNGTATDTE